MTALAIGYAGDPIDLPERLRARDAARRPRKPLQGVCLWRQVGRDIKPPLKACDHSKTGFFNHRLHRFSQIFGNGLRSA